MFSPHCVFDERSEEGMKEVNDNFVVGTVGSRLFDLPIFDIGIPKKLLTGHLKKQTFSCSFEILAAFPQLM